MPRQMYSKVAICGSNVCKCQSAISTVGYAKRHFRPMASRSLQTICYPRSHVEEVGHRALRYPSPHSTNNRKINRKGVKEWEDLFVGDKRWEPDDLFSAFFSSFLKCQCSSVRLIMRISQDVCPLTQLAPCREGKHHCDLAPPLWLWVTAPDGMARGQRVLNTALWATHSPRAKGYASCCAVTPLRGVLSGWTLRMCF